MGVERGAERGAERGVALIKEYNGILTKKKNQKQYLIQVVQDNRRKFPDCAKELILMDSDGE